MMSSERMKVSKFRSLRTSGRQVKIGHNSEKAGKVKMMLKSRQKDDRFFFKGPILRKTLLIKTIICDVK